MPSQIVLQINKKTMGIRRFTLLNGKLCMKKCRGSSFDQTMSCMRIETGQKKRGLS